MSVFKKYASVYDLLYKDKDYEKEAMHVAEILNKYGNGKIKEVLNLGCGTGRHDHILSGMGYNMTGVDMSEEMVEIANKPSSLPSPLNKGEGVGSLSIFKGKGLGIGLNGNGSSFYVGDIRTIDLKRKFDAVISMFHVMSYQNGDTDVIAVFNNVYRHLNKGGIFVFDCWYADAVLAERPEKRTKVVENDELLVTRHAVPVMHEDTRIVDVNYEIKVTEKTTGITEIFHETHNMRYFSVKEFKKFAEFTGLSVKSNFVDGWTLEIVAEKK